MGINRYKRIAELVSEAGSETAIAAAVLCRAVDDLRLSDTLSQDAWQFLMDWRGEAWANAADLDIHTIRRLARNVRDAAIARQLRKLEGRQRDDYTTNEANRAPSGMV